jgi:hypothetical protein
LLNITFIQSIPPVLRRENGMRPAQGFGTLGTGQDATLYGIFRQNLLRHYQCTHHPGVAASVGAVATRCPLAGEHGGKDVK